MSSNKLEITYPGLMLSLSVILQAFVIFTPMLFLIPNNSYSNGNIEYLRELLPFSLFLFYILSVIGSFSVLILVFDSPEKVTGNFHKYALRIGVTIIILTLIVTNIKSRDTEEGLWIKDFGYFALWLALWFKIIAMVLFYFENNNNKQF